MVCQGLDLPGGQAIPAFGGGNLPKTKLETCEANGRVSVCKGVYTVSVGKLHIIYIYILYIYICFLVF